ncbi:hypothetical protein KYC5002_11750 [Archangium violaceum]|uniref:hypothetical protein n=1 Tax=Archangium violaceum TaxID=83451 RepID=UPI002B2BA7E3|nr:hypothetical protein KYC5002_11750 [Archangium gephyra]
MTASAEGAPGSSASNTRRSSFASSADRSAPYSFTCQGETPAARVSGSCVSPGTCGDPNVPAPVNVKCSRTPSGVPNSSVEAIRVVEGSRAAPSRSNARSGT